MSSHTRPNRDVAATPAAVMCRAHLAESPAGWLLTLTVTPEALENLGSAARGGQLDLTPGQVSISITPNLVPGEPFDLGALRVVVSDEVTSGRRTTDCTPHGDRRDD